MSNVKVVTEKKVNLKRLAKSGGDLWTIMLDGTVEGKHYLYNLAKLISFTSQETRKTVDKPEAEVKYFSYFTVLMDNGETLNLPVNQGLYETYYEEFCDETGKIKDDNSLQGIQIEFDVKTFVDDKGNVIKDGKYPKKEVSSIKYSK